MRLSLPSSSSRSISISHSCLATSISTLVFNYSLYVWNNRVNTMEYSSNCSKIAGSIQIAILLKRNIWLTCKWDIMIMWYQNSIMQMRYQIQFSSVAQLCPTLCDPMNHSTPGLPVHHQLLESTQTHVHRVGDAIQRSHPLSSPSPSALNLSQHQGLFQWVSSSHQVAKVLEFQLQRQSFQWTLKTDL